MAAPQLGRSVTIPKAIEAGPGQHEQLSGLLACASDERRDAPHAEKKAARETVGVSR